MSTYSEIFRGPMTADNYTQCHNLMFRSGRTMTPAEVVVLGNVMSHRERWKTSPGQIAEQVGLSLGTVKKSLVGLRAKHLVVHRQNHNADGTFAGSFYWVTDLRFQLLEAGMTAEGVLVKAVHAALDSWLVEREDQPDGPSQPWCRICTTGESDIFD
jgi:DNA-binding MarR family transcriptional regulator